MQDSYAVMLMDEIKSLTQEVKNLNSTLTKVASNTNQDNALSNIVDALDSIARNTRQ